MTNVTLFTQRKTFVTERHPPQAPCSQYLVAHLCVGKMGLLFQQQQRSKVHPCYPIPVPVWAFFLLSF